MTPDHSAVRCTTLGRVEPGMIGLPGKNWTSREGSGKVVNAAGWIHSMAFHGRCCCRGKMH